MQIGVLFVFGVVQKLRGRLCKSRERLRQAFHDLGVRGVSEMSRPDHQVISQIAFAVDFSTPETQLPPEVLCFFWNFLDV